MKFSNILEWFSKPKNLWITIFIYTILAGLFVQLILLPYIVPSWQSEYGYGLLKGVDGPKFNRIALELANTIKTQGWSHWELTPSGQLVSGLAAIFYVLIYPAPWSVLPLNAFLNATVCVCFYYLLSNLVGNDRISIIAALPFIFFPSALLWNAQFHNENYAIPGVIFILFGWLLIVSKRERSWSLKAIVALISITLGSVLLGLVRVYILIGMSSLFVIAGLVLGIYWLFADFIALEYFKKVSLVGASFIIMFFTVSSINSSHLENSNSTDTSSLTDGEASNSGYDKASKKWEVSTALPTFIDQNLQDLASYRRTFVHASKEGGSSIDLDVTFNNAWEMIAYIPRAFQIGFFSPFPNIWFSPGEKAAGSAMRIVSAFEMLIAYFCLIGFPLFLWEYRGKPEMWVIVFVCTSMLIVYAMIIPNQGSLYRFRYPYYMPLVGFGLAGWLSKLSIKSPENPSE
jgi:putative peptidoglycan lipid II flippase